MDSKTLTAPEKGDNKHHDHKKLHVIVKYAAAVKPYKTEAAETTTLGQLKKAVLVAFGLEETSTKVFKLFHAGKEYADLNETLGQIACHQHELVFQLEEVIVQG